MSGACSHPFHSETCQCMNFCGLFHVRGGRHAQSMVRRKAKGEQTAALGPNKRMPSVAGDIDGALVGREAFDASWVAHQLTRLLAFCFWLSPVIDVVSDVCMYALQRSLEMPLTLDSRLTAS